MNEAKLLACPFCGKPATVKQAGKTNYWWVGCEIHLGPESSGCGVSHSDYDREEAIRKWNERSGGRQPEPSETGETKHVCISDLLERRFVIQTVMEEEELEGPMPDSIWNMLSTREGATEVLRANVRAIKFNIVKRLRSNAPHEPCGTDDAKQSGASTK